MEKTKNSMNIVMDSLGPGRGPENWFIQGTFVFKITAHTTDEETREVGMVNTKEDYEKKLHTHKYNPILFLIDLPLRLAYLYGCLNVSFQQTRDEEFVFWGRKIGENEWKKWFTVKKYRDSVYGENPEFL